MRKSAFDGSFYPSSKEKILFFIKEELKKAAINGKISAAYSYVVPHAGYIYSGGVAAYTYKAIQSNDEIKNIDTIVIVGPNHTGKGKPISVSLDDWETPIGKSINDRELSEKIIENSEYIEMDEEAHRDEHSIEVQLPFLEYLFPDKKLVFICMGDQSIKASRILSNLMIKAAESLGRKLIVIASSDFNHYESAEIANHKDHALLDELKKLDYTNFNKLVYELNDSACGFGPITVAMMFAKHMGAKSGVILKYANSGDKTLDYSSVVAYSSIAFV